MKVIAVIQDPEQIRKILAYLKRTAVSTNSMNCPLVQSLFLGPATLVIKILGSGRKQVRPKRTVNLDSDGGGLKIISR